MEKHFIHTFENGIRLIHKQVTNTKIAYCGFVLDIGSRNEQAHQQGLAHFWEHMAFKGTKRRKAFHIINRLEAVGGELNAYTTKEKICFYAYLLDSHYEKAVELLTDITFDSVFPEKQIEREKGVILEEMAMYLDSPEEAIQDEFDQQIFRQHSLGYNILGTNESVSAFKREDFQQFLQENLDTERIIFSSVGNFPPEKALKIASRYLAHLPRYRARPKRLPFSDYQPSFVQKEISGLQAHCAIGATAYSLADKKRLPFFMLNNLLGGPAMSSRLNLNLRERHGFVYAVEASYNAYTDTGIWGVFFGTEKKHLAKSIQLVQKELKRVQEQALGSLQLHQAKEQLIGQLAMSEENNMNFMLMMGKSLLDLGRIESLEEILSQIQAITAQDLLEVANEMFEEQRLSILQYLPEGK